MRKLLNTLYITNEDYYISRDRENILIKQDDKILRRFPIHILEGIVCFSYVGASPSVIKLCNENNISITFLTPQGRFCGKFVGMTNGNVLLRRTQYRMADNDEKGLEISKRFISAKVINSRKVLLRLIRDHGKRVDTKLVQAKIDYLKIQVDNIRNSGSSDHLRGIEGDSAREYFSCFDELILHQKDDFKFVSRSKRPPLNRVNAMLSFLYSLLTYEVQSALETVGLDSYVGFFHTDRPGRASLALDMIEELRAYLVDRFVITLINRKQIAKKDFVIKESGAVLLNDKGREKIINYWQKRKQTEITHGFINEKMPLGLLPYVQAQLMARYLRGDLKDYPAFIS